MKATKKNFQELVWFLVGDEDNIPRRMELRLKGEEVASLRDMRPDLRRDFWTGKPNMEKIFDSFDLNDEDDGTLSLWVDVDGISVRMTCDEIDLRN